MIQEELLKIIGLLIPLAPKRHLLLDFTQCHGMSTFEILVANVLVDIKLLISSCWKSSTIPLRDEWLSKLRWAAPF